MSQFDAYTQPSYIRALCAFLGPQHPAVQHLQDSKPGGSRGRQPNRPPEVVAQLELAVNAKAARCEAIDGDVAERMALARAYKHICRAHVARGMRVSREALRQWEENTCPPSRMIQLAKVLEVPFAWLEYGGEVHLPANSSLGVRVGAQAMAAREQLLGLTLPAVAEVPDDCSGTELMAALERMVVTESHMSTLARQAGGRWHVWAGQTVFVPWMPIAPHGLTRRYWPDEVEAIIVDALAGRRSVYGAWHEVKRRCEARGLAYPRLISLHKRVATERERVKRFGIDLNALVARACIAMR